MNISQGKFLISLDFELQWGVRHSVLPAVFCSKGKETREGLLKTLELFEQFEIFATFAIVGFLFCRDKDELLSCIPTNKPHYLNKNYSPYFSEYIQRYVGQNEKQDPLHYAPSLIDIISASGNHEIATHTLSHYFVNELGSDLISFEEDVAQALKLGRKKGYRIETIVFPRNQYNQDVLELCTKLGLKYYRGFENSAFNNPDSFVSSKFLRKAGRVLDTFLPLTGTQAYSLPISTPNTMINLPASRFFRPISSERFYLRNMQLLRIKQQMHFAAKNGKIFHLWWHPHNFSDNLTSSLAFLREILKFYKQLNSEYGFSASTINKACEI